MSSSLTSSPYKRYGSDVRSSTPRLWSFFNSFYAYNMKLLIVTQVVDTEDPFLGFFHGWLVELARRFECIEVICLREGKHSLPPHVRIHSLGKEDAERSSIVYAVRFLQNAWKLRRSYDAVFVHMNQEYILIAGWLWKLLGKRIYLWRNHYAGNLFTDIAAAFATKVFCTSKYSYTTKYKKTVIMPVGVDTDLFAPNTSVPRTPHSILFFSRFAPSKRPHVLLAALGNLNRTGIAFVASLFGTALARDAAYCGRVVRMVDELDLGSRVKFYEGVPHAEAPAIFNRHQIFVNLSSSGTYDKTIFEAAASGCMVIAASRDFAALAGERFMVQDDNPKTLAGTLQALLKLPVDEFAVLASQMQKKVLEGQSLKALADHLVVELSS